MESVVLECRGLRKRFREVEAVRGISFRIAQRETYGLLGPNGAGKTTTIAMVCGLLEPDEGEVVVAGRPLTTRSVGARAAIGYVPQELAIYPDLTARENLGFFAHLYGLSRAETKARVEEVLHVIGLAERAGDQAKTYSGGMQRRLDVALGLVARPQVLFLDEPTTGLDPEVRVAMWGEISTLAREEGLTILLTTHYLEEDDQLASQLAIVDRGEIVAEGSPEQLKAELRGDAISVELDADGGASVHEALARVDGVREVALEGRMLRARADQGARAVPAVLAALEAEGVSVAAVTVARASLDDVYLRHTGRTFGEADEGSSEPELTTAGSR